MILSIVCFPSCLPASGGVVGSTLWGTPLVLGSRPIKPQMMEAANFGPRATDDAGPSLKTNDYLGQSRALNHSALFVQIVKPSG